MRLVLFILYFLYCGTHDVGSSDDNNNNNEVSFSSLMHIISMLDNIENSCGLIDINKVVD